MNNTQTYIQLIDNFGKRSQVIVAIEELSELQKELCKYLRDDMDLSNIIEEMADCEIMLEQLKLIFGNSKEVERVKAYKIKRTRERYLKSIAK